MTVRVTRGAVWTVKSSTAMTLSRSVELKPKWVSPLSSIASFATQIRSKRKLFELEPYLEYT